MMTNRRSARAILALLAVLPLYSLKAQEPQSSLTVLKLTHPVPTTDLFEFSLDGPEASQNFDLRDGESEAFTLAPGSYTITEAVPEDWRLGHIGCGVVFDVGVASGAIQIELEPGDSVFCRFDNEMIDVPPPPAPPPGATDVPVLSPQALSILFMILAAAGAWVLRRSW